MTKGKKNDFEGIEGIETTRVRNRNQVKKEKKNKLKVREGRRQEVVR